MPEYDYFNGENFITFDLIEIDDEKQEVTVAVSDTGRISVRTFDLLFDGTFLVRKANAPLARTTTDSDITTVIMLRRTLRPAIDFLIIYYQIIVPGVTVMPVTGI